MKFINPFGMKVLTAKQMQSIDEHATSVYGIPSICLMENAGRAVAEAAVDILGSVAHKSITILAGHGNNGGDGLVAARHLENLKANVSIVLVGDESKMSEDTKQNYLIAQKMGLHIVKTSEMNNISETLYDYFSITNLIIDAILGTGIKGKLKKEYLEVIESTSCPGIPILSVDIPSGVNADTGQVNPDAVWANYTITFALPKIGLLTFPGAMHVGELSVAEIGIPLTEIERNDSSVSTLNLEALQIPFLDREPDTHKGTFGHLGVVAGSIGMTGAAALVCEGAMRIGTGLVSSIIPAGLNQIMEIKLTEAMTLPIGAKDSEYFLKSESDKIIEKLHKKDAVVIGPGLGRNEESIGLIDEFLPKLKIPAVIDADGLYQISLNPEILKECKLPLILTPHPGEMAMLCGKSVEEIQKDRLGTAREFAKKYGVVVVLKGAGTIIADKDGNAFINTTGCAGMATGGTGDVLAGIIGGFLAQGKSAMESGVYGAYIHGLAGELAEEAIGSIAMIATDVVRFIPNAIKLIKGESEQENECNCG